MKNAITTTFALALTTGVAFAAAHTMAMSDLDTDTDSMVSMDEYNSGLGANLDARYSTYDTDGDGAITNEEFREAEFRRYDRDRDSMLNEDEYGLFSGDDEVFGDS